MTAYILQFEDVTPDIRVVTIQMPKGQPYQFRAGQYADIHIDGHDPRPFSIASAPRADNTIDIHVRNSGRNISHKLCEDIKQGEEINVSPAKGHLGWHGGQNPTVFIAGGTGITPFLAMMEAEPHKPVTLFWGMNAEDDFYVRPRRNGLSAHYCTNIYPIDAYLKDPIDGAIIYLSGPPAMVRDSKAKLLSAGVDPANIIHDE